LCLLYFAAASFQQLLTGRGPALRAQAVCQTCQEPAAFARADQPRLVDVSTPTRRPGAHLP
jgi:hypothetical protein